jgi:hypothetical protein
VKDKGVSMLPLFVLRFNSEVTLLFLSKGFKMSKRMPKTGNIFKSPSGSLVVIVDSGREGHGRQGKVKMASWVSFDSSNSIGSTPLVGGMFTVDCPDCVMMGEVTTEDCETCKGSAEVERYEWGIFTDYDFVAENGKDLIKSLLSEGLKKLEKL